MVGVSSMCLTSTGYLVKKSFCLVFHTLLDKDIRRCVFFSIPGRDRDSREKICWLGSTYKKNGGGVSIGSSWAKLASFLFTLFLSRSRIFFLMSKATFEVARFLFCILLVARYDGIEESNSLCS